jgi:hypothetical protein
VRQVTEYAPSEKAPLLVDAPVVVQEEVAGNQVVALLAGAGVALAGGLAWAAVVIETRYDIGILAWVVGAATGAVIAQLAGSSTGIPHRIAAGCFAAAGIVVGKYVVFVHDLKDAMHQVFGSLGVSVGYLDTTQISFFVHHLTDIVRPIYILWLALAFFAAFRVGGRGSIFSR